MQYIFTLRYNTAQMHGCVAMAPDKYSTEAGHHRDDIAVEPKAYGDDRQQFGFNRYAERLNGRLAMIGFVSALLFEALTGQGVFGWLTQF